MLNKNIKKVPGRKGWYEFINKKGEHVTIQISETHCDPKDKKCLPNLWKKHGFIKTVFYDYLTVDTYVKTENGCFGRYNPTIGPNHKLNFKWVLPATKANEIKLLNEVYRLANK